jgi:hypothetical protein
VSAAVNATLQREGLNLPPDSAIDCSALSDNVRGAYLYRNGCDDHVQLVIRDPRVRGARFVPGIPPDPVSARAAQFAHYFRLSPDGTHLTRER